MASSADPPEGRSVRSGMPTTRVRRRGSSSSEMLRQELQVEAHPLAFLTGRVVEKVDDVSAKSIFGAAAFVEVERAHRIHFDLGHVRAGPRSVGVES
jgi:hypothetical protein